MLNKITDKKSESDFDIIEIEKIKNNYFVVIMNKKPYSYIQILPLENMKKEFPKKFEKKISLIQKH